jgi:HEPN domain-containing protein
MSCNRSTPDNPIEWLNRAASDLVLANNHIEDVYLEDLCFHAQQCVEKSFKAILLLKIGSFPYTHDLAVLAGLLEKMDLDVPDCFRPAVRLTRYAVQARYPGVDEPVEEEQWQFSVQTAQAILTWAQNIVRNHSCSI